MRNIAFKHVFRNFFTNDNRVIGTWTDGDSGGNDIEAHGLAGFDFIIVDDELNCHSSPNFLELIRTIENAGMAPFFRIRRYDADDAIQRYLDMGASGIVVPNIRCKEQVEHIMERTKYPPIGKRGYCTMVRANDYGCKYDAEEYLTRTNEDIAVMLLMEEKAAVDNIEEICSVPGVTAFLIGRMDLTLSLGIPVNYGDPALFENPILLDAMEKIIDAGHRHGIYVGLDVFNEDDLKRWAPKLDFAVYGGLAGVGGIRGNADLIDRYRAMSR